MRKDTCCECGCSLEDDNTQINYNGEKYCEDCYHETFITCDCCGETFDCNSETMIYCDDFYYCEKCTTNELFKCEECGEYYLLDKSYETNNGYLICGSCLEDSYFICEECNGIIHNEYYGSEGLCENCYRERQEQLGILHDYDYKPEAKFHRSIKDKNNIYLGIEIETECNISNNIEDIVTIWNKNIEDVSEDDFYAKSDGSLNYGIEFVSHPRTLQSWHEFKPNLQKACQALINLGVTSHDTKTCGLHIHISRNLMNEYHQTRLATFIYSQQENIEKIARRQSEEYAKFKYIQKGCYRNILLQSSRYEAINWENSRTVEFRFYRGTLNINTLLASIEFTHAAYKFTDKNISIAILVNSPQLAWQRFGEYILEHKKNYENLINYARHKFTNWI